MIVQPEASQLDVVSFNIQFLGHFKDRDNTALAALLTPFDIAVIQELVAPPFEGTSICQSCNPASSEASEALSVVSRRKSSPFWLRVSRPIRSRTSGQRPGSSAAS